MISFSSVPRSVDRDPKIPGKKPGTVKWWRLATPEPDYYLVVIRVTAIVDDDTIQCKVIDPKSGDEQPGNPVQVDLTNQAHVWPGPPSTFDRSLIAVGTDDPRDHVVMCFTEQWLKANAKAVFDQLTTETTGKWPWGEGVLLQKALAAVTDLEKRLRENNRRIADLEADLAKLHASRQQLAAMEDSLDAKLRACRQEPEESVSYQELQQHLAR